MIAGQAVAADLPYYPPVIEIPDVDHGYSGSFYLRGSAGLNLMWAHRVNPLDLQHYRIRLWLLDRCRCRF